jgi:hypothetical protein
MRCAATLKLALPQHDHRLTERPFPPALQLAEVTLYRLTVRSDRQPVIRVSQRDHDWQTATLIQRRQVEREWWWLNGALHAAAEAQIGRSIGKQQSFRAMQAQAREFDRRRAELTVRIAQRSSDVDIVYLNGYGFPAFRGGPMFYADQAGLPEVVRTLRRMAKQPARDPKAWEPAPLLVRLAEQGGTLSEPAGASS